MQVLSNKNIVLTRPEAQAKHVVNKLERLGAKVISFPTVIIKPVENNNELKQTIINIKQFDSIIFTSENAVKHFVKLIERYNVNFESDKFFVISIGRKTNEICKHFKINVDFIPAEYSWDGLVSEIDKINFEITKIFIPCSTLSDIRKYKELEKYGFEITAIPVYQNIVNTPDNLVDEIYLIEKTKIDLYIFTSPSTFNGFLKIMQIENPSEYFAYKNIAVIGPVTKQALEKFGVHASIIPQNYTMDDLIEEIIIFFRKNLNTVLGD